MQDLPLIMIPTRFVHLPTLPLTRTGKVDRSRLAAMAAEPMAVNGPQLPLATPLEQALTELCAEVLGVDRIDRRDNFFDVGGNSIFAAAFFSQLQERLGYQLPLSALAVAPTMEQLAKYVECGSLTSERSCLVPIQPRGTRPPLFCVHGWGGNVVGFYPLAAQMGHRQPVFGIQSKGLFDMASADQTVEQMAATYIEEILARFPESPVCLAGLSAGGLVAYEMAQQLWARGRPVGRLVLFDAVARANGGWSAERVVEAADRLGERFHHHVTQVLLGPREQRLLYVRQRAHSMKRRLSSHMWQWGISSRGGSGGTVADRWREVGEINYRAFRRYRLRPYPGNVTLFKAAERSPGSSRDPSYGWKEFAGGGVDVHVVPGNHTSMIAEPHVRELARTLERCIEDAV